MQSIADLRGHNSRAFGEDEPKSRAQKLTKAEADELIKIGARAARLLAAWSGVPAKRIVGKRQGDEALILRGVLFRYMRGRAAPMKFLAKVHDLDRCQPGADAERIELWEARNEPYGDMTEAVCDGLDLMLSIKPKHFMQTSTAELEADRACAAAIKEAKAATERLQPSAPKFVVITERSEAEELVQAGIERRRKQALDAEVRRLWAVIHAGAAEGATKEQIKDARKAGERLAELIQPR